MYRDIQSGIVGFVRITCNRESFIVEVYKTVYISFISFPNAKALKLKVKSRKKKLSDFS